MRIYLKALPPMMELFVWLLIYLVFYWNGVTWSSLKLILRDENQSMNSRHGPEIFVDAGSDIKISRGELDQVKRGADAKFYARLKMKLQVPKNSQLFPLNYFNFFSLERNPRTKFTQRIILLPSHTDTSGEDGFLRSKLLSDWARSGRIWT